MATNLFRSLRLNIFQAKSLLKTTATAGQIFYDDTNETIRIFTSTSTSNVVSVEAKIIQRFTAGTGPFTYNFNECSHFVHAGLTANFTANVINVPTTNHRLNIVRIVVEQGVTPYIPNTLKIANVSQVIKWKDGIVPTGTSNKIDHFAFELIRASSTWTVLGEYKTYG